MFVLAPNSVLAGRPPNSAGRPPPAAGAVLCVVLTTILPGPTRGGFRWCQSHGYSGIGGDDALLADAPHVLLDPLLGLSISRLGLVKRGEREWRQGFEKTTL